ncbi:MAG TPA: ATP-binding protein [candidate division Zixibacteria bacterium]|nr:ATP-binding protein [candidate division Zixibacteria bacterium]
MNTQTFTLSEASLGDLADIRDFVKKASLEMGGIEDAVSEIVLALNEAVTNVLIHGYGGNPGYVNIVLMRDGADLIIYLRDRALSFDPNTIPPPDIFVPLERRRPGGMGVHMMRNFTDEMHYQSDASGLNELKLVKRGAIDTRATERTE